MIFIFIPLFFQETLFYFLRFYISSLKELSSIESSYSLTFEYYKLQ
ncbi:hypothetical protein LEP1GSC034_4031 [Leptospira interrogans str. 2003000735]|nr:hypothetical protein LEP1GSC027_2132 [Leptospira interrogans str. 2002000624]EKP22623.1 hypothetical protein LEP1GSC117_1856 [Leptospira interrogans serovar Icterohaemorrhagiae str. Verdun LP]EKP77549.1 hypothetical protein LEP1GSC173_2765 [Leptospira interrogans str. HAI1594]EKQ36326.1 hypothetical protein LEP1GSC025_0734 [Leptospira interrogans str. 2002000621]EKQ47564.1 hypothetical protein LEP1GSC026_4642 [Leptospira interrogans str. 2002000623]EMJ70709.1 hypothetical protein LEP1GSC034